MKTKIILILFIFLFQATFASDTLKTVKILVPNGSSDSLIIIRNEHSKLKSTTSIDYCDFINCKIYANDGQYLGNTSPNQYDIESIINEYGNYGSTYSTTSIRNTFSKYGSQFSDISAYNSFATNPPRLFKFNSLNQSWELVAYITKNTFLYTGLYPKLDPDILISTLTSGNCLPEPIIGYPDIIVANMYIEEINFDVGDSVTLHFNIMNNSLYTISDIFYIEVWQDLNLLETFYINYLLPLNYAEGIIRFKITNPIHVIGIYSDVYDNILESIEYNNNLIMYSFAYIPDLVLKDIQLEYINDSIEINYEILNNGFDLVNDTLTVRIIANEDIFNKTIHANIEIGQSTIITDRVFSNIDTNTVIIFIDWYNNILELDDINNNVGYNFIFLDLNEPPIFTSSAITIATEDIEYIYNIIASDIDGDVLTITAPIKPDWLTFNDYGNGTALLSGTPDNSDVGDNNVTLTVNDGTISVDQNFTINVLNIFDPPSFTSTPITDAIEDTNYIYNIVVTDVDGDVLTITAPIKPDWLTFNDNGDGTALLSGTPDNSDVGNNNVTLTANDGTISVDQNFTINVSNTNDTPFFTSTPTINAIENTEYIYNIIASDVDGDVLTITAPIKPDWLTFNDYSNGTALLSGTPDNSDIGDNNVTLTVNDGTISVDQNFIINVINVNELINNSLSIFKIYPNPVQNVLILDLSNYYVEDLSIRIYDLMGVLLFENKYSYINCLIPISFKNYKKSMYILDIKLDNIYLRELIIRE